jgi:hypothetical protein
MVLAELEVIWQMVVVLQVMVLVVAVVALEIGLTLMYGMEQLAVKEKLIFLGN